MPDTTKATKGQIVDGTCDCKACTDRTTEMYYLNAYCANCDGTFILKLRKGDKPALGQECPHCGVSYRVGTRGLANV